MESGSQSIRDRYVLVTPVKDEIGTIRTTLDCVAQQTRLPSEWVIADDGSMDGTSEVVLRAAQRHQWIRTLRRASRSTRSFASVVEATQAGVDALECCDYEFIGLLDADLSFAPDYFERIIARFRGSPRLGLAGGMVVDSEEPPDKPPRNRRDVPGATQFFRRECFASLGRLLPIPEGGWDVLTCAMARMNGFETELITDLVVRHLKPRNIAQGHALRRAWQFGEREYAVGYGLVFESLKWLSRIGTPRSALLSAAVWLGYCATALSGRQRIVPHELVRFIRHEQRMRVTAFLRQLT